MTPRPVLRSRLKRNGHRRLVLRPEEAAKMLQQAEEALIADQVQEVACVLKTVC
jgi:hypothetical protein